MTTAYENCDHCAYLYYTAHPGDPGPQFPQHDEEIAPKVGPPMPYAEVKVVKEYRRRYHGQWMKPVGQPCKRCGDNSPRGTWPWVGPTWFRLHGVAGGPSVVFHHRSGEVGPDARDEPIVATVKTCQPVGALAA